MKKIYKSLIALCILTVLCAFVPKDVQAKKPKMKNTDAKIALKYDDRHTFNKEVKKITTISVKSSDKKVLKIADDDKKKVIAVGCGKAVVKLEDGKTIGVKVKKAKISLLLLIGQSNMEGSQYKFGSLYDYQNEYTVNEEGEVYSTYGPSTLKHSITNGCFKTVAPRLSIWNADEYVPDSLTDNSSEKEWKRTNNLTDAKTATGKTGVDGALAKEWVKKTDEKVWIVNAAHSGSSIKTWLPGEQMIDNNFWQAVNLYKACEQLLNKEIAAGRYKLSHKGYFWLQGETNKNMSAKKYLDNFVTMHKRLKEETSGESVKKKMEFAGILMVRAHKKATDSSDLYMTGPRKAQYYMCNSSKGAYKDIYLASHISEDWVTDDAVDKYFKSEYETETKFLEVSKMKKQDVKMPSKVIDVHPGVHYTQLGYNEIGRDAATNICYALKYASAPETETVVKLVGEDGYTDITSEVQTNFGEVSLTAKVFPAYKSKSLKVMRTEGIELNKWNVRLLADKYFSGKVKYVAGKQTKECTLWAYNSGNSIRATAKVQSY